MSLIYTVVGTKLGWVGIARSVAGLCRATLPQTSFYSALALLDDSSEKATADSSAFGDLPDRLRRYFAGEPVVFPDELDMGSASSFRCAVWQATRSIPFGETRSYRWVAEQVGKPTAARAVGQALAANPLPILVPCHRVIGSDGNLGGFGGSLEVKKWLLEMESSSSETKIVG